MDLQCIVSCASTATAAAAADDDDDDDDDAGSDLLTPHSRRSSLHA